MCKATLPKCNSGAAPTERSAVVGGSALRRAADAIIDKAKAMSATMLEADVGDIEFKDGTFTVAGTDEAIPLVEVAKASFAPMGQ